MPKLGEQLNIMFTGFLLLFFAFISNQPLCAHNAQPEMMLKIILHALFQTRLMPRIRPKQDPVDFGL